MDGGFLTFLRNILRLRANFLLVRSFHRIFKSGRCREDASFYIYLWLSLLEKERLATARFYVISRIVAEPVDPYTLRKE